MIARKCFKNRIKRAFLRYFFAILSIITLASGLGITSVLGAENVYAEPDDNITNVTDGVDGGNTPTNDANDADNASGDNNTINVVGDNSGNRVTVDNCQNSLGGMAWIVCTVTGTTSDAVDWLYDTIGELLVVSPVEAKDGTPIYEIWKYCRGITNIVFIIFLLVVIYSQITGVGISNYGLKKALPKLIVAAVLVNLSFLICQVGVDLSNVIGNGLRGVFTNVENTVMSSMDVSADNLIQARMAYAQLYNAISAGSVAAIGAGIISFESGAIWMLIPIILGALVAVVSGLITIALRQAVVALLVMIAPLAFVANILPNTEPLFKKWKKLLIQMLVFYPMFSLLFGASSLAGFAIMASAKDGFWLLIGAAVQVFPLFFSWSLMKMSGTILGTINARMHGIMARPLAASRNFASSRREAARAKHLASTRAYTPSLALRQYLANRKIARNAEFEENMATVKNRGLAYKASRNYDSRGAATKEGAREYEQQAMNMRYAEIIERDKNNMNKGLGALNAQPTNAALRTRLSQLDNANIVASDRLKIEKARGEVIEYENATGFHKRMEDAINAHFDDTAGYTTDKKGNRVPRGDYKMHDISDRVAARQAYNAASKIMEGNLADIQYAAATAAHGYDTQKKIIETKMGKYFDLTPPTRDVEYRLGELTKDANALQNIDAIISGMRILNQRGDTDLLKQQLDNVLNHGVELGTHASQSLASFLMFEVKDNDPFLRRFGKYINLETARAYNANERKVMNVTYDEYVMGYHDGETDLINEKNPTGRMYAKKGMKTLVEGTSLDNIERTALSNLDDSLKKAYGFDEEHADKEWDVSGYLKKRKEIQTAFEPAFISASLKWLSGSEQINSGVKFWTGYEQKQKKEEITTADGRKVKQVVTDENGDPVYEWVPIWSEKEFAGHEKEVKDYFKDRTMAYIKDQTPSQILGMRSDYRDAVMEHLINEYFEDNPGEKTAYENEVASIQAKYGDKDAKTAKKLRDADIKNLKMQTAGKQMRAILGKTGKLEQIYRTRRSGAANNAKDWLREWVGLDDEVAINNYLKNTDKQKKAEFKKKSSSSTDGDAGTVVGGFDDGDRAYFASRIRSIYDSWRDFDDDKFYEESAKWVKDELDGVSDVILKKYKEYHEANPHADDYELMEYLQALLRDANNY